MKCFKFLASIPTGTGNVFLGWWARKLGDKGWNEFGKILWKGAKTVEGTLQHECCMRLRVGYLTVWRYMPCQKALLDSPGGIQLSPLGVNISKLWLPLLPPQHHFLAPDFHSLRWIPQKLLAQVGITGQLKLPNTVLGATTTKSSCTTYSTTESGKPWTFKR